MSKLTVLKTAALSAIFFTAMAFSCQDHVVPEVPVEPEPEPEEEIIFRSNACGRTNGQPRAFPCEFQVVKVEFIYGKNDAVAGTVTQMDSVVQLTRAHPVYFNTMGIHGGFFSYWRTRVTIRRIADPVFPGAKEYIFRTAYRGWTDQVFDPITPRDEQLEKHVIDVPIGGTYTFLSGFYWEGGRGTGPRISNTTYILVQNVATSAALQKPPYSYDDYWDIAEAKMVSHMILTF